MTVSRKSKSTLREPGRIVAARWQVIFWKKQLDKLPGSRIFCVYNIINTITKTDKNTDDKPASLSTSRSTEVHCGQCGGVVVWFDTKYSLKGRG